MGASKCWLGLEDEKLTKIRFVTVSPVKFRVGDIVEAQISFIVIPLHGDQYKMSAVLRGLTLMDGTQTSVSEKLVLRYSPLTTYNRMLQ